jgi:uncharacterized membrane protein YhaH (DUF805 family)
MSFCPNCGNDVPEGINFCEKCGKPMQSPSPSSQIDNTDLDDEVENLSLWGYFVKCLKKYASFDGRARRKEYWGFVLFNSIFSWAIMLACALVSVFIFDDDNNILGTVLSYLYSFAVLLPGLAVLVRRMHDVGKSGWNWFWCLTIVGAFYVIYLTFLDSHPEENAYGPNPKTTADTL